MFDPNLSAVLVSSLANALIDPDTLKKAIDLLLYNASTFLQARRKKLLGEPQSPGKACQAESKPDLEAGEPKPAPLPLRSGIQLDDERLEYAEREIASLFRQLEIHHSLLTIKQEQVAQFSEFAPPYMRLGIINEQRAIVDKLERIRMIMEDMFDTKFPEIEQLAHIVMNVETFRGDPSHGI